MLLPVRLRPDVLSHNGPAALHDQSLSVLHTLLDRLEPAWLRSVVEERHRSPPSAQRIGLVDRGPIILVLRREKVIKRRERERLASNGPLGGSSSVPG